MDWNGKPYHSLDFYLRKRFGEKIYKLALDGGMTCPNRDGTLGTGGCLFCSGGGSGEFAQPGAGPEEIDGQIEAAKARVSRKVKGLAKYMAYFQSFTNTYAPLPYLEELFSRAAARPDIAALSVATRPDCLPPPVISLLSRINSRKPVFVELGLQTIHQKTADRIRRGYPLSCFEEALQSLRRAELPAVVHVILGLPGESRDMMLETVRYLGQAKIDGIKLQLLHVLKGTDLAGLYQKQPFPLMTLDEYVDLILDCVSILPPEVVIHRLTGDGPKSLLLAPLWSADKRLVLNTITRCFCERKEYQGKHFSQPL